MLGPEPLDAPRRAAWLMDRSWLYALNFSPYQSALLQEQALALRGSFRVRGEADGIRLLALCAPGDLMVNAPLDFIAPGAGAQLDLVYLGPNGLPEAIPDHDVAIIAASESAPDALQRLLPLYAAWDRPILNDPAKILPMSRDWLAATFAAVPGLVVAPTWLATRQDLDGGVSGGYPVLLRPLGSHAGHGLAKVEDAGSVAAYLADSDADAFYVSRFIEYRGASGWYEKYRIAFVDGAPFLCHMAASEHWMVHYLNAGMDRSEAKRAAEQRAFETFHQDFAGRHAGALAAVARTIGLDYFSIDCAEAPDGRLLVFEADVAAIIHSMDPPDLYPYKGAALQRCYEAFGQMLRRRAASSPPRQSSRGESAAIQG